MEKSSNMPEDFLIKRILEEHRAEVKGMMLTKYNEADAEEVVQEDGDESIYEEAGQETAPLAKGGGFSVVQGGV